MLLAKNFKLVAEMSQVEDAETLTKDLRGNPFVSLTTVFYGAVFEVELTDGKKINKFYQANEILDSYAEVEDEAEKEALAAVIGEIISYNKQDSDYVKHDVKNWNDALGALPEDKHTTALKSLLIHTP